MKLNAVSLFVLIIGSGDKDRQGFCVTFSPLSEIGRSSGSPAAPEILTSDFLEMSHDGSPSVLQLFPSPKTAGQSFADTSHTTESGMWPNVSNLQSTMAVALMRVCCFVLCICSSSQLQMSCHTCNTCGPIPMSHLSPRAMMIAP